MRHNDHIFTSHFCQCDFKKKLRRICLQRKLNTLTKLVHLLRGHLTDVPLDEEVEVRDDDEGWSEAWSRMIPHNYVVALELPVCVTPILHLVEGVTR